MADRFERRVRATLKGEVNSVAVGAPDASRLAEAAHRGPRTGRTLVIAASLAVLALVTIVVATARPERSTVLDAPARVTEAPTQVSEAAIQVSEALVDVTESPIEGTEVPSEAVQAPTPPPPSPAPSPTAPEEVEQPAAGPEDVLGVPLQARFDHTVTWTGDEVVVWGGGRTNWGGGPTPSTGSAFGDGALFDPDTALWQPMAPAPVTATSGHLAVWNGTEVLFIGGLQDPRQVLAYDPGSNTWESRSDAPFDLTSVDSAIASTGRSVLVWRSAVGMAAYDPATDVWEEVAAPPGTPDELVALHVDEATVPATVVAVVGAEGARSQGGHGIEVAVREPDGTWRRGPDLDRLIDVAESHAEFPLPSLTTLTDAGVLVVPTQGEPIPAALWDLEGDWVDLAVPPKNGCASNPSPIPIDGDAIAGNFCGPTWVRFDATIQTFEPFQQARPMVSGQVVFTGAELIAVAGICCDGTPSSGAVWASWRLPIGGGGS